MHQRRSRLSPGRQSESHAQRRRKVSRRANIRGRRPNPCERNELILIEHNSTKATSCQVSFTFWSRGRLLCKLSRSVSFFQIGEEVPHRVRQDSGRFIPHPTLHTPHCKPGRCGVSPLEEVAKDGAFARGKPPPLAHLLLYFTAKNYLQGYNHETYT